MFSCTIHPVNILGMPTPALQPGRDGNYFPVIVIYRQSHPEKKNKQINKATTAKTKELAKLLRLNNGNIVLDAHIIFALFYFPDRWTVVFSQTTLLNGGTHGVVNGLQRSPL